ncbi:cytochrome oxidase assembly protein ShyY1 [Kineococcus xinjiangensis]|uniref:SURF1-like protein n=1 Tax=Kineococcus xinjiangensis TaxID=512762 RepID=A0A2S6ITY6_9ACTN|nr:SURF1 family protein [Kineococcus xinjiangensis]PPK97605.1 cytochrome oxidase assembly protein ShyY1 [Kineococcus xinjiangensis]
MPPSVARVLLTRRWLLWTALLLVVVAACVALGVWQWQRGNVVVSAPAATRPVAPLADVVGGGDPLTADEVGRRVQVRGEWDPAAELLLPGRSLDGAEGAWVLGLARLPGGTGVPVVRGWLPAGAQAEPASGAVDLVGVVQPPEAQDHAAGSGPLPPGQAWVVSPALLVNQVDYPVVPAYVVASTAAGGLRAVPPPDPGSATRRLDWRNLGYAAQWWVFAVFAVAAWRRGLLEELRPPDPGEGHHDPHDPHEQGHDPHDPEDRSDELLEERTR